MRYFLLETCRPLGAWRRLAYRLPPRAHLASHRSRLTAAGYDYLAGEPFTSRRWTGRLWLAMLVPATRPTRVSLGPGPNPLNQESPPLSSRSRGHISAGHALSIRSLHPKTFIAPARLFFLISSSTTTAAQFRLWPSQQATSSRRTSSFSANHPGNPY